MTETPREAERLYKRKQAMEDFIMLGEGGSVNKLYDYYVEQAKLGKDVPTRSRKTIYQWAREDRWEENYLERSTVELEKQTELLFEFRKRGYNSLAFLTDKAISTLSVLMDDTDKRVAYQAAKDVLDRVGVAPPDKAAKINAADRAAAKSKVVEAAEKVPVNATEADYMRFFQQAAENKPSA